MDYKLKDNVQKIMLNSSTLYAQGTIYTDKDLVKENKEGIEKYFVEIKEAKKGKEGAVEGGK